MAELHRKTVDELVDLLDRGACSSVDIVRDVLETIRARDGAVQAYLHLDEEQALKDAAAADAARAGGAAGRLLGIPVAVKDLLNVRGQPCTCASKILEGYRAPYDASAVARLRAEGAVLLGRVNMDEFAMGSSNENSAFRPTRNPWNTECVPGGSSGGSAAAVAADLAVAALGSDTGGSIRQPAAFCGCVGLKPTYGRVSRYGLTAFASSLDQIGPLTKTVKDAARILECISGPDPMDSTALDVPAEDYAGMLEDASGDLRGIRLGVPKEYFVEGMDPEVERTVRAAIEHCRALGAEIVEVSLPHSPYAIAAYYIVATAEASANLARFDGVRYGLRVNGHDPIDQYGKTRAAGFGDEVKRRIILGTYVLSSGYYDAYYLRAQKVRTLIRGDFDRAFEQCDALVAPATPTAAFKLGEQVDDPLKMYLNDVLTVPVNLAGHCGISVPCGFTADGRPVGLQMIGPYLGESAILKAAHAYEQTTEWHRQRPVLKPET